MPSRPSSPAAAGPAASAARPTPSGAGSTTAGRFRPELHGLRGLAIGLVVLYHVWFDRVSGGVDVFLFISSFLLVGTFLRKADRGRAMRPPAYWARTFKRLLPPTAVVALATLVGVRLVLPADRWMTAITDAIGSVLHVQNWVLIRRGVDYYAAEETGASAYQHFWSLSIQGQVFLLWPLLIAGGVIVARRRGWSVRRVLAVVFTAVLVLSFAWSVHSTATQQEIAYFDTFARLWEFAAGSLLGLALPVWEERRARTRGRRRSRPRQPLVRVAVGWAGIIGLVSCGLLVDVQGAFPGWIAAWPLASAALVLWAGTTEHPLSVDRLLATRPGVVLGDISYGLYLVHWPLLTLYLAHAGKERAGVLDGLVLILLSLVLAWVLTKVVDSPIRRWPWAGQKARRGGLVVLTCLVLALTPLLGAREHLLGQQREAESRAVADNPGARVLDPDFTLHPDADPSAEPLPTAATIGKDWFTGTEPCTGALEPQGEPAERLSTRCAQIPGEEGGPVLVSAGNSRIEQFTGARAPLAAREGWTVITLWEGGCTYAPDAEVNEVCDQFSADTEAYIEQIAPEAVVLNTTFLTPEREEVLVPGIEQTLASLTGLGSSVIALRDQPRLTVQPVACTEEKGPEDPSCASPLPEPLTRERPDADLLADAGRSVIPLDVNDLVCPGDVCSPVIGNVRVSLDNDHITETYAISMQDAVDARLREGGFRW
jgi:peptidoglycan/LPS O-acetylase OafA/YrhL